MICRYTTTTRLPNISRHHLPSPLHAYTHKHIQSCGNYVLGAVYLLIFITIGAFIFANLVVAVVVTNLVRYGFTTFTYVLIIVTNRNLSLVDTNGTYCCEVSL